MREIERLETRNGSEMERCASGRTALKILDGGPPAGKKRGNSATRKRGKQGRALDPSIGGGVGDRKTFKANSGKPANHIS